MGKFNVGENITIDVQGNKALISIDLKHRGEVSKTGKSERVASTMGNVQIPGCDVKLGLNAYVPVYNRAD